MTGAGGAMDYERAGVAETYRRVRGLPDETLALWRDLLRELVPVPSVRCVVDLGCGTGRFVNCLTAAFGVPVIGLDPSPRMLALAAHEVAAAYTAAEAERLPLASASVDVAFLSPRALDERRLPSRSRLHALFVAVGFTEVTQRTVEQRITDSPEEYRQRVRARGFSSLQQISDEAFARGLPRFEAWSESLPPAEPVHEPVDVFVFRR